MVLKQEKLGTTPFERVLSLFRIVECRPDELITEFSIENDNKLKKMNSRRGWILPSIASSIFFITALTILNLALGGSPPPNYYMVIAAIALLLGVFLYLFSPMFFTDKFRRIEVTKIDRELHATIVTHSGKERHVTVPFERIFRVDLIQHATPRMIELYIDLKNDTSFKEGRKNGFIYQYQMYVGRPFEGIPDIEKYLRELLLHVEIIVEYKNPKHINVGVYNMKVR